MGDIVKSQKLANLPEVVSRLRKALARINRTYRAELVGKFVIFGGDSFEGVLRTPRHAYDVYRQVLLALRPVRVRCVVGVGKITDVAGGNVLEMSGPVFGRTAETLAEISRQRRLPKTYVRIVSGDPERDGTLNALAMLVAEIRNRWNDRSYQIAALSGRSAEEIADVLHISRQAVLKQLNRNSLAQVLEAEAEIRRLLADF